MWTFGGLIEGGVFYEEEVYPRANLWLREGAFINLWSAASIRVSSLTMHLNELFVGIGSYFSLKHMYCIIELMEVKSVAFTLKTSQHSFCKKK